MCTVNMTFEVPDKKHIDIEALKTQIRNYFGYLISVPGIVWQEDNSDEGSWDASPELLERMEKARLEISEGKCTVLRSNEDINAFFESL